MTLVQGERLYVQLRKYYFHYLGQEDASPFLGLDWVVANLLIPVSGIQAPSLYYFSKVLDDPAPNLPRDGQEFKRMAPPDRDMDGSLLLPFSHGALPLRTLGREWRARTHLRLAQTAAAVERFRLEHDRWPEDLSELVPEYLDEVPRDLFCLDGEPLRYVVRPDGSRRIYSVGRNHRDDGGLTHRLDEQGADIVFVLEAGPR